MNYSPSGVAHGSKGETIEQAIKFDKEGGINALVWHCSSVCRMQTFRFSSARFTSRKVDGSGGELKAQLPFKKLWDIVYDRITRVHNIHNIVWVCNTADSKWYPGNDKCDIATIDYYGNAGDHGALEDKFDELRNVTKSERVLALAEVGSIPDPELQAKENLPWAYWMAWNDEFIKDGKHNSQQFLKDTYNNKRVVTLDGTTKVKN
ncbi:hypothetical protein HAV15_012445 [Penicillium sp. str. |nr:hypothetical protein HAV15_012445 [Penicillium sp. str. \